MWDCDLVEDVDNLIFEFGFVCIDSDSAECNTICVFIIRDKARSKENTYIWVSV